MATIGLLYKAYLMVASVDLQILLRLRPYPMRGHRLLCKGSPMLSLTQHSIAAHRACCNRAIFDSSSMWQADTSCTADTGDVQKFPCRNRWIMGPGLWVLLLGFLGSVLSRDLFV